MIVRHKKGKFSNIKWNLLDRKSCDVSWIRGEGLKSNLRGLNQYNLLYWCSA